MFEQYLTKTGRLSCKQPKEVKNQWYTQRFKEAHWDTYDYSKIEYLNAATKVEIVCKEHGSFFQTPNNHLTGQGCPKCYGNNTKTIEEYTQDFTQVHGNTYEYSKVEYTGALTKVEIICKIHGSFFQTPDNHSKGKGCPKCQNHNQNTLYVLKCLNTGLIKIGITNNIKRRIYDIGGNLEHIYHIVTENPRQLETRLHKQYKDYNAFNYTVNNGGTEFFQLTDEQLESLIQEIKCLEN